MLTRCFAAFGIVALGTLAWAGCGGSDASPGTAPNENDAGNTTEAGAGGDAAGTGADAASTTDSGLTGKDITYGKCPAFTKCGGDVVGTWTVSGGCLSDEAFAGAKQKCPGLQESDVVIKADGTVTATATTIQRKTTIGLRAKVVVPKVCVPLPNATCDTVAFGLQSGLGGGPTFDKATCTEAGANCNCDVAKTMKDDASDTYTTADGTLTTGGSPGRTFDYCVAGSKLTYKETTSGGDALDLVIELTK